MKHWKLKKRSMLKLIIHIVSTNANLDNNQSDGQKIERFG
jgi:hypothetical protein